ncbi:hypothetical protein AVEN_246804-1 [Araneus ventricosus]|uniref:Secreted protein n=1 Tax=Araneus ventricosus TaxID=182803 RepID=A0A4Y2MQL1_ARAVE|nr:hypothetical protein AVEN_246804-1 [Araneus ventricosus]
MTTFDLHLLTILPIAYLLEDVSVITRGRSDLVVRSWCRRIPDSKPDSTEDPPCMRALCTLNLTLRVKLPPAVLVRNFGKRRANSSVVLVI